MFKREKKVYLELTDAERRLVRMYLMNWRNKLTAQGRDAGPVNDLHPLEHRADPEPGNTAGGHGLGVIPQLFDCQRRAA